MSWVKVRLSYFLNRKRFLMHACRSTPFTGTSWTVNRSRKFRPISECLWRTD
jgi:hypothetical protein